MTIKGKPKNLNTFLTGTADPSAEANPADPRSGPRITKTIRISREIEAALKEAAYTQSKATGQRVAESDVIHEALKKYLNI